MAFRFICALVAASPFILNTNSVYGQTTPPSNCSQLVGGDVVDLSLATGIPVGTLVGNPDQGDTTYEEGAISGSRLSVGVIQDVGCYELSGGTLLLTEGTDPSNGLSSRPILDIGGTDGIGNGVGYLLLSGGAEIALTADDASPVVSVGFGNVLGPYDGTGYLALDNSTLTLNVDSVLGYNGASEEGGVGLNVGTRGGTGEIVMNNGDLNMSGTSGVGMVLGSGAGSAGTFTAANGSSVQLSEEAYPGATANGVTVSVGQQWDQNDGGTGVLTVEESFFSLVSQPSYVNLIVGQNTGNGTVELIGDTAWLELLSFSDGASLDVGANGTGLLDVSDGALVTVDAADGSNSVLQIAPVSNGTSIGTVSVRGGSELRVGAGTNGGEIVVGAQSASNADVSVASLSIHNSIVSAGSSVSVGKQNGDGLVNGSIVLSDGGLLASPTIDVWDGGSIAGTGTLMGDTTVHAGGSLAPGLSPGSILFDGNLTLEEGSQIFIEVEGFTPGQWDVLNITGDLVVESFFDLIVSFVGVTPLEDTEFNFLNVGGILDPEFSTFARISLLGLGGGSEISLSGTNSSVSLYTDRVIPLSPVPLPASMPFLIGAFGLMIGKARTGARQRA